MGEHNNYYLLHYKRDLFKKEKPHIIKLYYNIFVVPFKIYKRYFWVGIVGIQKFWLD